MYKIHKIHTFFFFLLLSALSFQAKIHCKTGFYEMIINKKSKAIRTENALFPDYALPAYQKNDFSTLNGKNKLTIRDFYHVEGGGGGGNCQLQSLKKIIEVHYPNEPKWKNIDVQSIRLMGVKVAREILANHEKKIAGQDFNETLETYYQRLVTGIHLDIVENNDSIPEYNEIKKKFNRVLKDIYNRSDLPDLNGKLSILKKYQADYETLVDRSENGEARKALQKNLDAVVIEIEAIRTKIKMENEKLQPLKDHAENEYFENLNNLQKHFLTQLGFSPLANTQEDYLALAERNGFCCGYTHLITLSIAFDNTIEVYNAETNGTLSYAEFTIPGNTQTPLLLLRVGDGHYRAILSSK